tara:strand:+ start:1524 stop:2585 length:1062 start_codon:yes stop_codon:yes gene_type:complete
MDKKDDFFELAALRQKIDFLDHKIVDYLQERMNVARDVAQYKINKDLPLTHPVREQQLLQTLKSHVENPSLKGKIDDLYELIFQCSKKEQTTVFLQHLDRYKAPQSIGVLGYGHFGRMLVNLFNRVLPSSELRVYDIKAQCLPVESASLKEVVNSQWLILAVPIPSLQKVLQQISKITPQETIVIDVCSVKVYPVRWMVETLGKEYQIIASHPMFGPESTLQGNDYEDLNLMLHNVSAKKDNYENFREFWKLMGVNIVEITPEEHDRYAAYTINYNHYIGRLGQLVGIRPTPIDTRGFRIMYKSLEYVTHDTWELFYSMQHYNPYSEEMRERVSECMSELQSKLAQYSSGGKT